jgi:hypothetical protein
MLSQKHPPLCHPGTVVEQSGGTVPQTTVPPGITLKGYLTGGGTVKVSARSTSTGTVTETVAQ